MIKPQPLQILVQKAKEAKEYRFNRETFEKEALLVLEQSITLVDKVALFETESGVSLEHLSSATPSESLCTISYESGKCFVEMCSQKYPSGLYVPYSLRLDLMREIRTGDELLFALKEPLEVVKVKTKANEEKEEIEKFKREQYQQDNNKCIQCGSAVHSVAEPFVRVKRKSEDLYIHSKCITKPTSIYLLKAMHSPQIIKDNINYAKIEGSSDCALKEGDLIELGRSLEIKNWILKDVLPNDFVPLRNALKDVKCRVCYQSYTTPTNPLLSPCTCSTPICYECLRKSITITRAKAGTSQNYLEWDGKCEVCKAEIKVPVKFLCIPETGAYILLKRNTGFSLFKVDETAYFNLGRENGTLQLKASGISTNHAEIWYLEKPDKFYLKNMSKFGTLICRKRFEVSEGIKESFQVGPYLVQISLLRHA